MGKKILTVLTAVLLVGISSASAAIKNVKVGGDISIYGIYRKNFDFTKDTVTKDSTGWLMTTTRIYVNSELTDNVAAVIQLINERDWGRNVGPGGKNSNNIELDLAYIELSDMFVPGLTATIGRQEIVFGDAFVVGNLNPDVVIPSNSADLSPRISGDAIKLDYKLAAVPLTLTGFVAKIDEQYATATVTPPDTGLDQNLYGINVNYQVPTAEAEIEGYFVGFSNARGTKNSANELNVQTFGARVAHEVAAAPGFSYKGEFAHQWGKTTGLDNKGYAGYVGAEYAFQNIAWEPNIGLTYYYFSGDNKPADGNDETWNAPYSDTAGDSIGPIADASGLVGFGQQSNMQVIKFSGSIQPTEKINLGLDWFNDQLIKVAPGAKKELGNEIDLNLGYTYSDDIEFALSFGYFSRGSAIKNAVGAGSSADALQVVGSVAVAF